MVLCTHGVAVTLRVFVTVQVVLEVGITNGPQRLICWRLRPRPPALCVACLRKSPAHDVQALLQHLAIGQHQHRHRAFGGQGQHGGGLVAQRGQFMRLVSHARLQQGHASAHGVGAAAVGV